MVGTVSETHKAIAIIQARCSSTRLPGKVLKLLAGKPMIWHIVQRTKACKLISQVVVATSIESSDDPLAEFCENAGIVCYRGSLSNVLSRYIEVLDQQPHDYVARITGDCPLIHPPFIDRQIELLSLYNADKVQLKQGSALLEGQGVHSSRSLKHVAERSNHPDDLEHVGSRYFSEHPEKFRTVELRMPEELVKPWRLTVDEQDDYALMSQIYERLYQGRLIPIGEVTSLLDRHPELMEVNQKVQHSLINQELAAKRESKRGTALASEPW
jgi:spore coat polysaccharide biosynthesis protein SpsF